MQLPISLLLSVQLYRAPFLSYSTLKNTVTLKSKSGVTQGH